MNAPMTDRAIQPGDMVIVLRSCCAEDAVGQVHTVDAIRDNGGNGRCTDCGYQTTERVAIFNGRKSLWMRPLSWLKRIPPADESDRAFIYDSMTQPAKEPA